jgi:nucleotide-binding universal stress UspA family protein
MVVLGLYGHPRFQERLLGGVSQHLLDHLAMPLLMSH